MSRFIVFFPKKVYAAQEKTLEITARGIIVNVKGCAKLRRKGVRSSSGSDQKPKQEGNNP